MSLSRCGLAVCTTSLVLLTHAGMASAHGVDISAELEPVSDEGDAMVATLQLTDETGEVCVAIDPAPPSTAVSAIRPTGDNVLIILGEGFGPSEACQLFDVDAVNAVLADVDAHEFVLAFGDNESSGTLTKPAPPESETALADAAAEDDEINVPLVFGVGAAIGVTFAVVRSRLRRRADRR